MRKHPEVLALFAIALGLFANMGLEAGLRRVQQESFRIRPLVVQAEKIDIDRVAEEAVGVAVREVLREVCR
jgi:hypothetical protein